MIHQKWCFLLARACVAVSICGLAPASAQTVKAVFEKLDLLGRYSQDCKKPTTEQNLYVIHQAIDGDRVRRTQYSSPTNRQFSLLIDHATQSKPNELTYAGQREDGRYNSVMRLDGKRIRVMESTKEGSGVVIAGGRFVNGNAETPWFDKCLGPESHATSGLWPPDRLNERIEELARTRLANNLNPLARGSYFLIFYARNANEFAGLARYSLMLLTATSQKPEELPVKRVFHRAGEEHAILKISSWRGEFDAASAARKVYGPYREDGFYLIPTGFLTREGQLLIDYAVNASGIALLKLPTANAMNVTKNFGNLDPAPGAKPSLAAVQAYIRYRWPGFPVPTSLP